MAKDSEKIGICKLCRRTGPLCKSHIVSDAIFSRCGYTKEGATAKRVKQIAVDDEGRIVHVGRSSPGTGFYERLLCRGCEDRRQRLETAFIPLLFDEWLPQIGGACRQIPPECMGLLPLRVDYRVFRLYFFWMFWIAGVATRAGFENFNLTSEQEQTLRHHILNDDPGSPEMLSCYFAACPIRRREFLECNIHGLFDAMFPPENYDLSVVRMMAAGLLWYLDFDGIPVFPEGPGINADGEFGVFVTNNCFLDSPAGELFGAPPASSDIALENLERIRRHMDRRPAR